MVYDWRVHGWRSYGITREKIVMVETNSLSDLERSVSIQDAYELMSKIKADFATKRNIFFESVPFGKWGISCVVAKNLSGDILSTGFGKGTDWEIGSFGECIEHLHLSDVANTPENYDSSIETSTLLQSDVFFQVGNLLNKRSKSIRAIPHAVLGETNTEYVPTSMFGLRRTNVGRALEDHELFFSRYSSSNGTAFGLNRNDALLHAILEILERHEISKVFHSLIEGSDLDHDFYLVNNYSFDIRIKKIADRLPEMGTLEPVQTLILKTEFGAFFSFSFTRAMRQGKNSLVWGAGCSLFRNLAIYRSVAECEQSMQADVPKEDDQVYQLALQYPAFNKISQFGSDQFKKQPQLYSAELPIKMTTKEQLSFLSNTISLSGRSVLFYEHQSVNTNYSVVSVYITNTEKFFGIIFANPVLPISHLQKFVEDNSK
jgi:ribosomal protein S12 methylthiotransferase accessory factor